MRPGATDDSSKSGPLFTGAAGLVAAVALFAAAALVIAAFSAVVEIRVHDVVRNSQSGSERHGAALILLALAGGGLAGAALWTRRTVLLLGVLLIGAAVLVIALGSDLPDLDETGFFGQAYEDARAGAGAGFWLELVGGAGFVASGLIGPLALRSRRPGAPDAPERPAA